MASFNDYEPYYRNDKVRFSLTARLLNDFNLKSVFGKVQNWLPERQGNTTESYSKIRLYTCCEWSDLN